MNTFIRKNHRSLFYASWLILCIIQARFTELLDDEAYYWVYSKFLAWGYFDHPPMIAALIKIGYSIFHDELGVRLLSLLLSTLTLLICEKLIDKKDPFVFYLIVLSITALQLSGFVAVPDTPLIFFTALFFWCYKRFFQQMTLVNSFFLGLVTAALFYSKYHGLLVVLFVILSNLKLLSRYQTYVAGFVALVLFLPHLWWQYQHDWITFRYQLFENNIEPYRISYTFEYVFGQILLAGPLAGILLLPAALLSKSKNDLAKALKFTLTGIYGFFLVSSLRGSVEANWTAPVMVPLIVLSHNYFTESTTRFAVGAYKWLVRLLPVTIILVLFARAVMLFDIVPLKAIRERCHSWHNWPQVMKEKSEGLPVVFGNSYQRASKYWFYSGQTTYSLNSYRERTNNFYLWPIEDSLLGRPVFIFDIYRLDSFPQKIKTSLGTLGYKFDSSFASFARIQIKPAQRVYRLRPGQRLQMKCRAEMPNDYLPFLKAHPNINAEVFLAIFNKEGWVKNIPVPLTVYQIFPAEFPIDLDPGVSTGQYFMMFSIYVSGTFTAPRTSEKIKLVVD
jgi:hypothetical protein